MDYDVYRLSLPKEAGFWLIYTAISGLAAYAFYDSLYAFILFMPLGILIRRRFKEVLKEKRRDKVRRQFRDMIDSFSSALIAGCSPENAVREAHKDMLRLYGSEGLIVRELEHFLDRMAAGVSLEEVFDDFAARISVEDITVFSEITGIALQSGGNTGRIMGNTVRMMREKDETEREIEVILSGRRYEQRIMCLIPFGIILYFRISAGNFLDVLYHNPAGIVIMTISLLVYIASCHIAGKIAKIRV